IDLYITFKHINLVYTFSDKHEEDVTGIYNTSVEHFLIFALEAMLQKDMHPQELHVINNTYLGGLYNHDKEIMKRKRDYLSKGEELPKKWINHRNLSHILNNIDPRHIIILLDFFAERYGARLRKGCVGKYCYSRDKYEYIIKFIERRYGSLSEYIEWENPAYFYHYLNYYNLSQQYPQMLQYIDVIFPTIEDKRRIARLE
ncbi:MAG: hypothetical protein IKF90_25820, partial [Parasporobacterium sp.]|nr:hypothetical protein [Parasporobacterium sp.]